MLIFGFLQVVYALIYVDIDSVYEWILTSAVNVVVLDDQAELNVSSF
jgi:hypothetical protein